MKGTYNEPKFVDVFRKRFSEAKKIAGSAGQLRLVVSNSHPRQIDKNSLVAEIIEQQALLHSNDAILLRRFTSGRIVFWNRGAQKLYGWSKKKATGKPVYNLLRTELPEPPGDIKAKLRRHGCWTGELVQTRKDGKKIVVASYWSLRQSPNGGPTEILEVNYNVTERKHSCTKSQETERLALVGTMAAVFAHEVANPLSGIVRLPAVCRERSRREGIRCILSCGPLSKERCGSRSVGNIAQRVSFSCGAATTRPAN